MSSKKQFYKRVSKLLGAALKSVRRLFHGKTWTSFGIYMKFPFFPELLGIFLVS